MKSFRISGRPSSIGMTFAVLLSILLIGVFYFQGAGNAYAAHASFNPHLVRISPEYLSAGNQIGSGDAKFTCQTPGAALRCYGPKQIRNAYSIQPLLNQGYTGKGRTIVIIDAFQSPTIVNDLQFFDKTFGLPNPKFNVIAPFGLTPFNPNDPNQISWSGEITLDVEWSHAIAPSATIDLVLAVSNQDQDIYNVTKYAIDHNLGDVISQSFGEAETCMDPNILRAQHQLFEEARDKGISVFASSADTGAAQLTCDGSTYFLSASTPASDPLVTSVGATYLNANPKSGQYIGEAAWNDSFGASGGGFSTIYPRPGYQNGFFSHSGRGVPDVSYNGDVNGGVLVAWSESGQGANLFFIFGGTSAGSPQWAAITALADQFAQQRLGWLNPSLYNIGRNASLYAACFHDIRVGTNTFTGAGSNGQTVTIQGYNTRVGWDAVTGLGTPIASTLVKTLADG